MNPLHKQQPAYIKQYELVPIAEIPAEFLDGRVVKVFRHSPLVGPSGPYHCRYDKRSKQWQLGKTPIKYISHFAYPEETEGAKS